MRRRSWDASLSIPAASAAFLTISQSTFGVMSWPQICPDLLIALNRQPSLIPLASVQRSIASFTQEVDDYPMLFPEARRTSCPHSRFHSAQATTNKKSKNGMVPLAPEAVALATSVKRKSAASSSPSVCVRRWDTYSSPICRARPRSVPYPEIS